MTQDTHARRSGVRELMARLCEPAESETGWRHLSLIRWLILLDIAMLAAVVYDAPYFQVARVLVRGTDTEYVRQFIAVEKLRGRSLLAIDPGALGRQVELAPAVKSVQVDRRLPNELVLSVQERQAVAVWAAPAGVFVVDDEGVIIRRAEGEPLPTIHSNATSSLQPGSQVDSAAVDLVVRLGSALTASFDWQAVRYDFAYPAALTVTTNQGWRVVFGQTDDLEYKFEVLRQIQQVAKQRNQAIELVDLRSNVRPYYRPVQTAAVPPAR